MRTTVIMTILTLCLIAGTAWPCGGPFDPTPGIAAGRGHSVLRLPEETGDREFDTLLNSEAIESPEVEPGDPYPTENTRSVMRGDTIEQDLEQLREAEKDNPDSGPVVDEYAALRQALSDYVRALFAARERSEYPYRKKDETPAEVEPFDIKPYEPMLAKIPEEFSRYMRGAIAYHNAGYDDAIKEFEGVLALPAEKRKYRSTWAAFMLGKTWAKKEPARAAQYYEKTRTLAKEGFADPLRLAADSVAWQATAENSAGDFLHAIHHGAQVSKYLPDTVRYSSEPLSIACYRAFNAPTLDSSLIEDPLCRRVILAWLVSGPASDDCIRKLLEALEKEHAQEVIPGAERLAWTAYRSGNMELAARCVARADPNEPYARWVKAQLLLRDGKIDEGRVLLRETADSLNDQPSDYQWIQNDLNAELGVLHLNQQDYRGALDAFRRIDEYLDALYIARWVLTVDELEDYVRVHSDPASGDRTLYMAFGAGSLRNVLATRLAATGEWERAAPYFLPSAEGGEVDGLAAQVAQYVKDGKDENLPPKRRAESLFEAAQIIVRFGESLLPYMQYPSDLPDAYYDPERPGLREGFPPTPDELARVKANIGAILAEAPDAPLLSKPGDAGDRFRVMGGAKFHAYYAAELLRKCANLLPKNDVLAAKALHQGGCLLKARDPKAADWFYKALVKRNPNLLIAQRAKKLGWFPKNFTEEAAYQPLPPRWKRYGPRFVPLGTQVIMWALF